MARRKNDLNVRRRIEEVIRDGEHLDVRDADHRSHSSAVTWSDCTQGQIGGKRD